MKGVFGKYLDVDLTSGTIKDYEIPENWYRKFLGGRGIGMRILLEELEPNIDPLGPENILLFGTGPLQGTKVAGGGRNIVLAKSPKTDAANESYVGGFFPHELGTSGYDGILVRGQAENPVYLVLEGGEATLKDASNLWGNGTRETEKLLQEKHEGVKVSSIGPAGENLVKFSCIINDRNRAAGRPGLGAVMGSKKLKAIAINGGVKKDYHDQETLKEARGDFARNLMQDPTIEPLSNLGTAASVEPLNEAGILPTRNFQDGYFENADAIGGKAMEDTILAGSDNCTGCPVRCKRVVETKFDDEEVIEEYGGPEYETLGAFGSLCDVDNLDAIALANQKCNQYGLDTISAGNIIAFLMEANERNLIDDGPEWGDGEAMVKMVDDMAHRNGIGEELSDGLDVYADRIGADFDVQIKGVEVPMHEPRGKKGVAISYATTPRGANHMEGLHDPAIEDVNDPTEELGPIEQKDRLTWEDKARLQKTFEDLSSFTNSLVICNFVSFYRGVSSSQYPYPKIREVLNAATGLGIDADEMLDIGERNYVIRKILSANEGYTRKDDDLPKRLKEPLGNGVCEGEDIPEKQFQDVLDEYYKLRGFDEFGPTDEKLASIGLDNLRGRIDRDQ